MHKYTILYPCTKMDVWETPGRHHHTVSYVQKCSHKIIGVYLIFHINDTKTYFLSPGNQVGMYTLASEQICPHSHKCIHDQMHSPLSPRFAYYILHGDLILLPLSIWIRNQSPSKYTWLNKNMHWIKSTLTSEENTSNRQPNHSIHPDSSNWFLI